MIGYLEIHTTDNEVYRQNFESPTPVEFRNEVDRFIKTFQENGFSTAEKPKQLSGKHGTYKMVYYPFSAIRKIEVHQL